jgi:IS605 OrfB family transposase
MLRTIKAYSLAINPIKWGGLELLAQAYAGEKADHLSTFNTDASFGNTDHYEQFRDTLLDSAYTSLHELQARMWKMALKDAYETILKNWAILAIDLRGKVSQLSGWSKEQKHYANWLLKNEKRLARCVGEVAPIAQDIQLTVAQRQQVQHYLRREVRRHRSKRPQVKLARSVCLDADMYTLFEQKGRLYIKVMNLKDQARITIPLTGKHSIQGTVRLVLDPERQRIEVHYTAQLDVPESLTREPAGLDAGLSEVFTDEFGTHYGAAFGSVLVKQSDRICDQGRKRNKLYQLEKKYRRQGNLKKANRIRKFNLGTKKQKAKQRLAKTEISRQVNTEIKQLLKSRQPSIIVSEKLNLRGKAHSKNMSRRVSAWVRGTLDERLAFKASAGGSCRKHVNPAYSSQTCPYCGYLHKINRSGDTFQCQHCGHRDDADRVAALNLKTRLNDPDITLFTPKEQVKAILNNRFTARLREAEGDQSRSVSGKTPGTKRKRRQPESETTGTIQQIPSARHNVYV